MVKRIVAKFTSRRPRAPIELGRAPVELIAGKKSITGRGVARLHLGTRERVVVHVELGGSPLAHEFARAKPQLLMRFGPNGRPTKVIYTTSREIDSAVTLDLLANGSTITLCRDRRLRLTSATLHLLNFPAFVCLGAKTDFIYRTKSGERRLGRTVLRHDGWELEIQELPSAAAQIALLKADGGNAITHGVRITRDEGRTFSILALERIVNDLHRFVSFARGSWTSVFGAVGFDAHGTVVYEDWGSRLAAPWQSPSSWFDIHHGECLAEAFSGFVTLMHHSDLGPAARAALYWYLRSNRAGDGAGVDSGLILSQAALERLSLACLAHGGLPTNGAAAEKLRRACQHLKLPIAIPKEASKLRSAKRKKVFEDSPHAIVALRNELVHPNKRLPVRAGSLVPQGWRLAQWYVELFLLKLSGYRGVYSNRVAARWVGQIERMPWAK